MNIPSLLGLTRSLLMYYAIPFRITRLANFYAQFVRPDDLCFDLGAHVGSRIAAFLRIGARVVAAEPQPLFFDLLRRLYGRNPSVVLLDQAVGAAPGEAMLHVSRRTPTVTTLSRAWADSVQRAPSFSGVTWDDALIVRVTTLDALVEQFGKPAFCKIDVEGFELEVVKGLSQPLDALSLEYMPAAPDIAIACVGHLAALGDYEFNHSPGETHRLASPRWSSASDTQAWLLALAVNAPSGDLYARLRSAGL